MLRLKVIRSRWVVFLHDVAWVPLAITFAYQLRFSELFVPEAFVPSYLLLVVAGFFSHTATFWLFGCYRGVWRFASIPDVIRLSKAVIAGAMVATIVMFVSNRLQMVPRSVLVLYPLMLLVGTGASRLVFRISKDRSSIFARSDSPRALVVGAGRGGDMLVRDLLRQGTYFPIAIVDDDKQKFGAEIHGVRVRGTIDDISDIAKTHFIEIILIAIPNASRNTMDRILEQCAKAALPIKTLPTLDGHTYTEASPNDVLRPLNIEDLLGREEVDLDDVAIEAFLRDRVVLITGAGGSIGSELCLQVAANSPKRLVLLDNSELNLYQAERTLRRRYPEISIYPVFGDIRNFNSINALVSRYRPEVIMHAAAYKHVPIVESNPVEGVRNNVFGTKIVADAAVRNGVDKFVLISTDKTVNPCSVMGASKRVAELYCQNLSRHSNVHFVTTRFGNVLGSTGSVVPLFEQQISGGGPVTVTHPEMTRYFMSIQEAASLILQAGAMGNGGEIYVMDMGEPVRIQDLAEKMIRLHVGNSKKEIRIEYTGLRAGEKLHEELFYESEELLGTNHPKLLLASAFPVDWEALNANLEQLAEAVHMDDPEKVIAELCKLVPEFRPERQNRLNDGGPALRLVR